MTQIVIILVFSVAMLVFMIFPAMKIVEFIETKITLSEMAHNVIVLSTTVLLSLCIGLFLKFA